MPVSQVAEDIIVEQIGEHMDVSVPEIQEQIAERISELMREQIVPRFWALWSMCRTCAELVPQESSQDPIMEQLVGVSVPQIEEVPEPLQLVAKERSHKELVSRLWISMSMQSRRKSRK